MATYFVLLEAIFRLWYKIIKIHNLKRPKMPRIYKYLKPFYDI